MVAPVRVSNPPNPYLKENIEWLGEAPQIKLEVYLETVASIISENDSPDIGFRYSINPYRGCFHGCAYCYARPTHNYIGFGAGTDFERKIVVKHNAASRLREAFQKKSWQGELIVFSGVTDCYQPLEASYKVTRQCLDVCREFRNPVAIITKGALIRRDIDVLVKLKAEADVRVIMSLAFASDKDSRELEPYAPSPSARLRAITELSQAGIDVGVGVAPIIPGVNDYAIPEILERSYACGARTAFMSLLRLPKSVKEVFTERLAASFPDRTTKVLNKMRGMKGGTLNRPEFGERMKGSGPEWEAIQWLFKQKCAELGFNRESVESRASTFRRPSRQLSMFS